MFTIRAFYKFSRLTELPKLQGELREFAARQSILGTVLLAPEGINGTVAGSAAAMEAWIDRLREQAGLEDLEFKESTSDIAPFRRLKVKIKQEIITIREPSASPLVHVGEYLDSESWHELIQREGVTLIDTRNAYEVAEGTFRGAINPKTERFGDFPSWAAQNLDPSRHPEVAMFCTGGIRCEKASALLLSRGFKKVYHLKGGILKYLEDIRPDRSLFEGTCYIFDERDTVDGELKPRPRCALPSGS